MWRRNPCGGGIHVKEENEGLAIIINKLWFSPFVAGILSWLSFLGWLSLNCEFLGG